MVFLISAIIAAVMSTFYTLYGWFLPVSSRNATVIESNETLLPSCANTTIADFDTSNINYFTTHYETFNDVVFFEIDESLLTLSDATKCICTPMRTVSGISGIQWQLHVFPCIKNYIKVVVESNANKTDHIKYSYRLKLVNTTFNIVMSNNLAWISHAELAKFGANGHCNIIIMVEGTFTLAETQVTVTPSLPAPPQQIVVPDLAKDKDSYDSALVVDDKQIHVHRMFLSMISPIFYSKFLAPQTKDDYIKITDFDYDAVQSSIDYIYGRQKERLGIDEVVGIYRFAVKYEMKTVSANMEAWLMLHVDVNSFCKVVTELWPVASPTMKTCFGRLYYQNLEQITLTDAFAALPMAKDVIRAAILFKKTVETAKVNDGKWKWQ